MSYAHYFFTGVTRSGERFIARYDGEFIGSYPTRIEANAALKSVIRKRS